MKYDPASHHRRSIRLAGYDYSSPGLYFITICTHERTQLFGEIVNGESVLSAPGRMVDSWWRRLSEKFPGVLIQEFVIMPNHMHALLALTNFPDAGKPGNATAPLQKVQPPALGRVLQWYKTVTTRAYFRGVHSAGWPPVHQTLWQRNYYEHVVRTPRATSRITTYILENPGRWQADAENPGATLRAPDPILEILSDDR